MLPTLGVRLPRLMLAARSAQRDKPSYQFLSEALNAPQVTSSATVNGSDAVFDRASISSGSARSYAASRSVGLAANGNTRAPC